MQNSGVKGFEMDVGLKKTFFVEKFFLVKLDRLYDDLKILG